MCFASYIYLKPHRLFDVTQLCRKTRGPSGLNCVIGYPCALISSIDVAIRNIATAVTTVTSHQCSRALVDCFRLSWRHQNIHLLFVLWSQEYGSREVPHKNIFYLVITRNFLAITTYVSRNYEKLSRIYEKLSRNYEKLSRNCEKLSRNYDKLSRNYEKLSRNYEKLIS